MSCMPQNSLSFQQLTRSANVLCQLLGATIAKGKSCDKKRVGRLRWL
jgi:hypothetical protein